MTDIYKIVNRLPDKKKSASLPKIITAKDSRRKTMRGHDYYVCNDKIIKVDFVDWKDC